MTKQEFKSLPLGRKVVYLVKKHCWDGVLAAYLVLVLSTFVYQQAFEEPPVLKVDMINGNQETSDQNAFSEFLRQQGLEGETVEVEKRLQFQSTSDAPLLMPDALIYCDAAAEKTDVYFWNTEDLERVLAKHALVDLRYIFPPEFMLANQERIVYSAPLLEGGYPCGIALKDNAWVQENEYYGDCTVGICRTTKNPGLTREFIEFIS